MRRKSSYCVLRRKESKGHLETTLTLKIERVTSKFVVTQRNEEPNHISNGDKIGTPHIREV